MLLPSRCVFGDPWAVRGLPSFVREDRLIKRIREVNSAGVMLD